MTSTPGHGHMGIGDPLLQQELAWEKTPEKAIFT